MRYSKKSGTRPGVVNTQNRRQNRHEVYSVRPSVGGELTNDRGLESGVFILRGIRQQEVVCLGWSGGEGSSPKVAERCI